MTKTHLKLVTPTTKKRAVTPRRQPNNELRSREYLTETEVEKLIEAAKDNRYGHRDATMLLVASGSTRSPSKPQPVLTHVCPSYGRHRLNAPTVPTFTRATASIVGFGQQRGTHGRLLVVEIRHLVPCFRLWAGKMPELAMCASAEQCTLCLQ